MRLKKIKLSGFKSFVDPTTVVLPADIVGIVGPNGCGKSNVIDAVRWVMGESSAKHLRGESMADVIFNGSNSRKPVGTASIELIFDNADGSIGGQYASYSEISVKRQVNREGQSAYYLNSTRCRKRDITDVFLGTGLGPRSYSIIEQGMISRVIEARPEELRGYLEEAAGISLYKERRKETERRIRDTTENLERLDDVRDEVTRQLEKLRRQADTAERYKALKNEERERRAELFVIRLRDFDRQRETFQRELAERENALQSEIARQRALEREAEEVRARHAEQSDRLNEVQGEFYGLGSDIARVEQQINHRRELRESARRELERNRDALGDVESGLSQDREKLAVLRERLAELEPESDEAAEVEAQAREVLEAAQNELERWREAWERFNAEAAEPVRNAQVERARIEQLERRAEELARRRQRLAQETESLRLDDAVSELDDLREEQAELDEAIEVQRERVEAAQLRLDERRGWQDDLVAELDEARGRRHRDEARLTSLRTLQQAAMGAEEPVSRWLEARDLDAAERLVSLLEVESGWERAVETVLSDALHAVVADDLDAVDLSAAEELEQGRVMLLGGGGADRPPPSQARLLSDYVSAPWPVDNLFGRVYAASDLAEARAAAAGLAPDESVITPQGVWLGHRWVRICAADDGSESGALLREREIAALERDTTALAERIEAKETELERLRAEIADEEEHRDEAAESLAELERNRSGLGARIEARRNRVDEVRARRETLTAEREEVAETIAATEDDVRAARRRLEQALDAGERHDTQRERLTEEKLQVQQQLDDARDRLAEAQSRRHDIALRLESAGSARSSLEQSIHRLESQRGRTAERNAELEQSLSGLEGGDEDLQLERERLLERRVQVEETLTAARTRLGEAESRLRELETERAAVETRVSELRESMEGTRFRDYELKIRAQTQAEQLAELAVDRDAVAARLPEEADEAAWQRELDQLESRVKRLGPINLAAIDEYRQLDERKAYLDSQHADLSEAMETLQSAIRRIDRETRQRFKETFEKVNAGLQRLFPRLFGGGQAYLELTGEDLLETGVTIMARPPGKKISNIHLLSGGEKALTAVSLVFAIFELNPAPFCMLDEVDAPLDEANVGRFCDMVREMSSRVQFIVITHNKTTMQAASHLTGVTMNEPGVSRLVSVDVDEAAEMVS